MVCCEGVVAIKCSSRPVLTCPPQLLWAVHPLCVWRIAASCSGISKPRQPIPLQLAAKMACFLPWNARISLIPFPPLPYAPRLARISCHFVSAAWPCIE